MDYRSQYNKTWKKDMDAGGGPIIVEIDGYMPLERRIEQIIQAGHRLIEHRTAEAYYHFHTGEEPDLSFSDPTMDKGYDMADASIGVMQSEAIIADLNDHLSQAKARKASSEAEKAAKASESVSKGGNPLPDPKAL